MRLCCRWWPDPLLGRRVFGRRDLADGGTCGHWLLKQSADRSLDFLGAACYGGVYLLTSLLVLAVALVSLRRGMRRDDPDLVWRAGILAAVGGVQHVVLLGLPALAGGILAIRAANRRTPRPAGTLVAAIRQSWGLPGAVAFFLLTGLFFVYFPAVGPSMVLEVITNEKDAGTRRRGDTGTSPRLPLLPLSSSPPLPLLPFSSRRDFLRRSLGIALGGALVPYFSTGRRADASRRTIGPGSPRSDWADRARASPRAAMRHADLVACCDVDRPGRRSSPRRQDGHLRRLPQAAGTPRRQPGDHRHARPLARGHRHRRHAIGQGRLLREAADVDHRGEPGRSAARSARPAACCRSARSSGAWGCSSRPWPWSGKRPLGTRRAGPSARSRRAAGRALRRRDRRRRA